MLDPTVFPGRQDVERSPVHILNTHNNRASVGLLPFKGNLFKLRLSHVIDHLLLCAAAGHGSSKGAEGGGGAVMSWRTQ